MADQLDLRAAAGMDQSDPSGLKGDQPPQRLEQRLGSFRDPGRGGGDPDHLFGGLQVTGGKLVHLDLDG
nr:hypothetical protein [Micromonospora sp. DSM 115978]